jgi:hypothetical protein
MGPHVKQVIPGAGGYLDPFVFLDHFGPFQKNPGSGGVPPHPHAGIATITYLFSGSNRHQDSYGHDAVIKSGDLAWMQAGKGIVHAEGMNENLTTTETIHGLQLWISLPAKEKFIEPSFHHYPAVTLPFFQTGTSSIKVILGEMNGHRSPVSSLSPAYIFEVHIPANQQIDLPIKPGDSCGLYLIEGGLEADGKKIEPVHMIQFDQTGDILSIKAITDSHAVILGGTPLQDPIIAFASFVMNTEDQIQQVISNYQNGKMGTVQL